MTEQTADLLELTTLVVAAHVENNRVHSSELPDLIRDVHGTFARLGQAPQPVLVPEKPKGAVGIRKSLADPAKIVSMIDGKSYSSLTRHLKRHGHTAESYREAQSLPHDNPMVAAAYSEMRRTISKGIGFGRKKVDQVADQVEEAAAPVVDAVKQIAKRARRKAADA